MAMLARESIRSESSRLDKMVAASAESVGRHMPGVATLDDLTAMIAADPHGHRYEISPEGVLSVTPPPDFEHAIIATRLTGWLAAAGWPAEKITQAVGLRIPGSDGGVGGRIPDLVVWGTVPAPPRTVWLPVDGVLLVVEIISAGSKAADTMTKCVEYAGAGIAQYWTVDRDPSQTVTMHRLAQDGYRVGAVMPLAWVLNTASAEYLD